VSRAANGDEVAFARLVNEYDSDLARVAYVTAGGDADVAEEAVQAAWTVAWRKLHAVRDPEKVKGWLVAVAANEARQAIRRRHRRAIVELRVRPAGESPHEQDDRIERIDLVNALAHLEPDDRMLLALRYVAGFDSFEIAAATGRSASGTRARLARLLDRLRKELGDG
jgi:RNA polymerase sigma factor (sigma-70 family)